jgi:hypothetical protein
MYSIYVKAVAVHVFAIMFVTSAWGRFKLCHSVCKYIDRLLTTRKYSTSMQLLLSIPINDAGEFIIDVGQSALFPRDLHVHLAGSERVVASNVKTTSAEMPMWWSLSTREHLEDIQFTKDNESDARFVLEYNTCLCRISRVLNKCSKVDVRPVVVKAYCPAETICLS